MKFSKKTPPIGFYIYFYLRDDFTPYYVGKGKGIRAWKKDRGEVGKPVDLSKILIVEHDLSEVCAFIMERYYIKWFGRKDIGTGILRNKTNGGEGASGRPLSEAHKNKLRGPRGPLSEEHKANLRRPKRPRSEEHKINSRKPRGPRTEEHSAAIKKAKQKALLRRKESEAGKSTEEHKAAAKSQ